MFTLAIITKHRRKNKANSEVKAESSTRYCEVCMSRIALSITNKDFWVVLYQQHWNEVALMGGLMF